MSTEVRQVRQQEIKLIKYDSPEVNIKFTGRSSSMRALDSDPVWQILLEYRVGDIISSTYALMGEFKAVWNDRAGYFPAVVEDPTSPLSGTLTGTFTPTGLNVAGRVTLVGLNSVSWTALPTTALTKRNALCVINTSGIEIVLNYSAGIAGYVGVPLGSGNQRFYDVTENIVVYGKSASGTPTILVEELS